jgi:hypothetical protein
LLYAVDLAPQDEELRFMAALQLARESRLIEAKTMFTPLAYEPHLAQKWRTYNRKIMEALTRGDGRYAVALMSAPRSASPVPEKVK